jgi:hypothetical protein
VTDDNDNGSDKCQIIVEMSSTHISVARSKILKEDFSFVAALSTFSRLVMEDPTHRARSARPTALVVLLPYRQRDRPDSIHRCSTRLSSPTTILCKHQEQRAGRPPKTLHAESHRSIVPSSHRPSCHRAIVPAIVPDVHPGRLNDGLKG